MPSPRIRKGQAPGHHPRDVFRERFMQRFTDPAFRVEQVALDRQEAIAWQR